MYDNKTTLGLYLRSEVPYLPRFSISRLVNLGRLPTFDCLLVLTITFKGHIPSSYLSITFPLWCMTLVRRHESSDDCS